MTLRFRVQRWVLGWAGIASPTQHPPLISLRKPVISSEARYLLSISNVAVIGKASEGCENLANCSSKTKVFLCIIITYPLYYFSMPFFIIRQFSIFYISANKVAKYSSEIFMAGIGKETAGIGEHTNKPA